MSVELTPVSGNDEIEDAKYIYLIDLQGKKKAGLTDYP